MNIIFLFLRYTWLVSVIFKILLTLIFTLKPTVNTYTYLTSKQCQLTLVNPFPANTTHRPNVGPTLDRCVVFDLNEGGAGGL